MKLLLIEDDTTLFNEIKERLSQWSYEVYGVADFHHVMQELAEVKLLLDQQLHQKRMTFMEPIPIEKGTVQ
nr:hypothetical protein [Rossellomorea aquimaris]